MAEIQKLEFRKMLPGQGEEVCALVRKAIDATEQNGITALGKMALERYVSPEAVHQRTDMGYVHELLYVSGVLAGVIELKGPRISMLYIHPDYANRGLGSRLIARAVSHCAEAVPDAKQMIAHATDDAANFYERVGFVRSGPRKENGGIFSTPYKLSLTPRDQGLPAKLHSKSVDFFVFTGTGNSLLAAQAVAEVLRQEGVSVRFLSMDQPCPESLSSDTAVGLAFPVACFSTYPTVWRFINSMPSGGGREVFMAGTCGGAGAGMQGPLRRVLLQKGYKPVAAKIFVMPGNYNNKTLPLEKNARRVEKSMLDLRSFAYDLLRGRLEWSGGIPLLSEFLYRLSGTRRPWDFFYKFVYGPIVVDPEKCVRCKRCAEQCPEKAILMEEYPAVDSRLCESCQRCVAFCPSGALHVPGKPAEPYRAMDFENLRNVFHKG